MFGSMWASATGMRTSALFLDTTAHNIANINTEGFRRHGMSFSELAHVAWHEMSAQPLYQPLSLQGPETALVEMTRGHGVSGAAIELDGGQGALIATGRPSDLAVEGAGYLILGDAGDRVLGYSRSISFHLDPEGHVVDGAGRFLMLDPGERLQLPPDTVGDLTIDSDGTVGVSVGEEGQAQELGQLQLMMPARPGDVVALGDGLHGIEGGTAVPAGEAGAIRQGALESSNVDLATEMMNLILAQRAFQLNGRVLQTADQMLDLATLMRR